MNAAKMFEIMRIMDSPRLRLFDPGLSTIY